MGAGDEGRDAVFLGVRGFGGLAVWGVFCGRCCLRGGSVFRGSGREVKGAGGRGVHGEGSRGTLVLGVVWAHTGPPGMGVNGLLCCDERMKGRWEIRPAVAARNMTRSVVVHCACCLVVISIHPCVGLQEMRGEHVPHVLRREHSHGLIGVPGGLGAEPGVLLFCFHFILGPEERNQVFYFLFYSKSKFLLC